MAASERLTTVVSTKGQVILPKPLRDDGRWPAGTKLTVEVSGDGVILRPAAPLFPRKTVDEVFGMLKSHYNGPPKTVEEMDAGVMAEARRRARD